MATAGPSTPRKTALRATVTTKDDIKAQFGLPTYNSLFEFLKNFISTNNLNGLQINQVPEHVFKRLIPEALEAAPKLEEETDEKKRQTIIQDRFREQLSDTRTRQRKAVESQQLSDLKNFNTVGNVDKDSLSGSTHTSSRPMTITRNSVQDEPDNIEYILEKRVRQPVAEPISEESIMVMVKLVHSHGAGFLLGKDDLWDGQEYRFDLLCTALEEEMDFDRNRHCVLFRSKGVVCQIKVNRNVKNAMKLASQNAIADPVWFVIEGSIDQAEKILLGIAAGIPDQEPGTVSPTVPTTGDKGKRPRTDEPPRTYNLNLNYSIFKLSD
jgi:hypothetical protein